MSFAGRGTALNVLTVLAGSALGLLLKEVVPASLQEIALIAIGLVTIGLGLKMLIATQSILLVAGALLLGGAIGVLLGIEAGIDALAEWARARLGAGGTFSEGLVTASLLYVVGPMTLLGCTQDALEKKIELLALKSLLDGVSSIFLAAALGWGVLLSAAVVLVVQGGLTLAARPARKLAENEALMRETSAVGGAILLAIGLGLLGLGDFRAAAFIPALVLAAVAAGLWMKPKPTPA